MGMRISLSIGAALVLVSSAASLEGQGRTSSRVPMCPGLSKPLVSPNGRWAIECRPKQDNDGPHRIYLKDLNSGRSEALRSFPRWVTVFWSPNSERLAVTDGEGSNVASSFVYRVEPQIQVLDVFPLLQKQAAPATLAGLDRMDHIYVEVSGWADNTHLNVRLTAHGDGSSLDRRFTLVVPSEQ